MDSCTFLCSSVSCKLEADSLAMTVAPALSPSLPCTSATLCQTSPWAFLYLLAKRRSLLAAISGQAANLSNASLPRFTQRPCSTQKEEIGTWPDLGETIKSML